MSKDYSKYTDYQLSVGALNRNSTVLSADIVSSLVNDCYVVSSYDELSALSACVPGDVAVVSSTIGGNTGTIERKVFYYADDAWQPLSGHNKSDSIYFDNDLSIAGDWLSVDGILSGNTIQSKGKPLDWLLSSLPTFIDKNTSKVTIDSDPTVVDLSIYKVTNDQFADRVLDDEHPISSNEMFIIEDDYIDCYGQDIRNVLSSDEATNAATVGQVSAAKAELCAYADEISAQAKAELSQKLDLSGGTLTGSLTIKDPREMGVPLSLYQNNRNFSISNPNIFGGRWIITYSNVGEAYNGVFMPNITSSNSTLALAAKDHVEGNLAALDANGNPIDSHKKPDDFQSALSQTQLDNIDAVPGKRDYHDLSYIPEKSTSGNFGVKRWSFVNLSIGDSSTFVWDEPRGQWVTQSDTNAYVTGSYADGVWTFSYYYSSTLLGSWSGFSATTTLTNGNQVRFAAESDSIALLSDLSALAKAASPATEGNLAALSSNGDLIDSGLSKDGVENLFFAQYYPDGSVKSSAEFTPGIKYNDPDTAARTITVKPFCNIDGTAENDNSSLIGRVVIPPFVDALGNPYIADDGTRYKVVGVSGGESEKSNDNLTAVIAPNTLTTIADYTFNGCTALISISLPAATTIWHYAFNKCSQLASISLPAATTIGESAFDRCAALISISLPAATSIGYSAFSGCTALTSISLPVATTIGEVAFNGCTALASVSLPAATTIQNYAFYGCSVLTSVLLPAAITIQGEAFSSCTALTSISLPVATTIQGEAFSGCSSLASIDFGATSRPTVPSLGASAFNSVPTTCMIIVPNDQYDEWVTADGWRDLVTAGYRFLHYSEWEYARKYKVPGLSVDNTPANVNMVHISQDDYEQLVFNDNALSNTLYVVSGDYINAYDQQIKNVAPGNELSDAVNLEQLNAVDNKTQCLNAISSNSVLSDFYNTVTLSGVNAVTIETMCSALFELVKTLGY